MPEFHMAGLSPRRQREILAQASAARIQDEIRVARVIMAQHPDTTRDAALRLAAELVARDYAAGKAPA